MQENDALSLLGFGAPKDPPKKDPAKKNETPLMLQNPKTQTYSPPLPTAIFRSETNKNLNEAPSLMALSQANTTLGAMDLAPSGGGRPDADGYLTLVEANDWYRYGGGQALNVDLSKINLSGIRAVDFPMGVGSIKSFNLLIHSSSLNDGLVYGSITLRLYENNTVRAFSDDFDMKNWGNPLNWPRNVETKLGASYAGQGTPFTINFNGSAQIETMGLDYKFK